jgi:cobaltochelatase CobN
LLALVLCTISTLLFGSRAAAQDQPHIAVVSIHIAEMPTIARTAAKRVAGDVAIDFYGLGGGLVPGIEGVDLGRYDLVVIDAAGPRLLNYSAQIEAVKRRTKVLMVGAGTPVTGNIDSAAHPDVARYWSAATEQNYAGLFLYAARLTGRSVAVPPPAVFPSLALWHPDADHPFEALADYLAWQLKRLPDARSRPRIGVLFYRNLVLAQNTAVIAALVREIEQQGGLPVPIWREGGGDLASSLLKGEQIDALVLCANRINYADAEAGAAEAQRLGVPPLGCATDYRRGADEWRVDRGGFSPEQTGELALSELEGIVEPMVVGARSVSADGTAAYVAISEQVRWRIARAMAWARLHRLPNAEKRIVVTYHNEEPGAADVGSDPDSYLDAQGSLVALLQRLRREDYDTGTSPLPDAARLGQMMAAQTNVAAGDMNALRQRIADGAITIDEAEYLRWYAALPQAVREETERLWGPPPGDMMTASIDGRNVIVVPAFRIGKVTIAAHPLWGPQDPRAVVALGALPPHHQYLAFYLWMQHEERTDAFLPIFTQLSLMPGKQEGPAANDTIGLLIGAIPHISPLPLQANGGVGNKRRANAITVGFMPEFLRAGLSPDLARIGQLLGMTLLDRAAVRAATQRAGLARALGLNPRTAPWAQLEPTLRRYLAEAAAAPMPNGGHVLGRVPDKATTAQLVQAMLAGNDNAAPLLDNIARTIAGETVLDPDKATQARDYAHRIAQAPREIDAIVAALAGGYVAPGPMQDAIRNPDALPAGRNPYTLDVRAVPTREAWETGKRLANELLAAHRVKHAGPPRKVAFILWSGETAQNGGTAEAQILHLLGVEPVWNARGQVTEVTLVPRSTIGRPRVDVLVTTSGTYRDHFGEKLALIARAVRLAADADEPDNAVRAETQARVAASIRAGVAPDFANKRALRRIFSTAPGAYSPSTQFAIKQGWQAERLDRLYKARLGHAYDDDGAGEADSAAFAANLERVDAAVFGRTSSAYGVLDTPLPAAYLGGLISAVRGQTGRSIDAYIANGQASGAARIESLDRFYARERDSRYLNPAWIKAMMAGGYNGARHMADLVESMELWEATKPDLVSDDDWRAVRDVYVNDRYKLGLKEWFAQHNPAAGAKLVEAAGLIGSRSVDRAGPSTSDGARAAEAPSLSSRINEAPGAPGTPSVSGYELQEVPPPTARAQDQRVPGYLLILPMILLFSIGAAYRPRW